MKTLAKLLLLPLVAIVILPAPAFALPPLVEVRMNKRTGLDGGWSGTANTSSGFISRASGYAYSGSFGGAQGSGNASASFGVLRTYADIQCATNGLFWNVTSTARFRDNRVTDAPGRTGQPGFVTVKFTIHGSNSLQAPWPPPVGSGQPPSECRSEYQLLVNDGLVRQRVQEINADGSTGFPTCEPGICVDFLGIEQTVTYGVTFGTPYDFDFLIFSKPILYTFSGFQGRSTSDMGNTAVWGGIVSVTDASGNPVTDYTDTAASGANYNLPIAPVCAAPSNGLAGWWPGDGNTRDIQSANNGTLESGATYGAGRVGQAFSMPGSGARVHIPHSAALDFSGAQDYTVDFWIKAGPQTGSGGTLIEKNGGTYPYSIKLQPDGSVSAGFSDATTTVSVISTGSGTPGKVDDQLWHHIAVLFRHSTKVLDLYIDGSLNASQSYTATLGSLANGQDLYFGARSDSSNSFVGSLDEVDISSGALSLAEIQAIAAAADLGKCRAPVAASSVVSRKTHGGADTFDIDLPSSGAPGIECRGPGSDHQLLFTFPAAVKVGGVTITSGTATSATASSPTPSEVLVDLVGVTNAQYLTVNLVGVSDGVATNDVPVRVGFLAGDTNGSGAVSASDIALTKSLSGTPASGSNFRSDVNLSSSINSADIGLVKSRSGDVLPPP